MGLIPTWPGEDEVARAVTVTTTQRPPGGVVAVAWCVYTFGFLCGAFAATTAWLILR